MEKRKIDLDSIDAYNKLYGLTTHHPLVTVIDLKEATILVSLLWLAVILSLPMERLSVPLVSAEAQKHRIAKSPSMLLSNSSS